MLWFTWIGWELAVSTDFFFSGVLLAFVASFYFHFVIAGSVLSTVQLVRCDFSTCLREFWGFTSLSLLDFVSFFVIMGAKMSTKHIQRHSKTISWLIFVRIQLNEIQLSKSRDAPQISSHEGIAADDIFLMYNAYQLAVGVRSHRKYPQVFCLPKPP